MGNLDPHGNPPSKEDTLNDDEHKISTVVQYVPGVIDEHEGDAIARGVATAAHAVGDNVAQPALDGVVSAAKTVGGGVKSAAGSVADGAASAATTVGEGVKNAAGSVADGVKGGFDTVKGWFGG